MTGALHAIGPGAGADGGGAGRPVPPLNLVGDYGGGALYLAFGLLAALFERQRSGRGQVVDAAMVDGVASLLSIFHGLAAAGSWDPSQRQANLLDGGAPFYDSYQTADGRFVAVGALEPKFFAELAQRIGLDAGFVAGQYDRRQWPAMRESIAAIFRRHSRDHWCTLLEGSDACFAPVLSLAEAPGHAHASERGGYVEVGGVVQPAPAPRFSRSRADAPRAAVPAGHDTDELLAEAGFSTEEIAALRAAGAAAGDRDER